MSNEYLHREDAPFGDDVWKAIDETVVGTAKSQLAGRRLLDVEGPFGLGLKVIPTADAMVESTEDDVDLEAPCMTPVAVIRSSFVLPARDIAAYKQTGLPMDLSDAAAATIACARQEDQLIFNGSESLQVAGLLNAKGVQSVELADWSEVGAAADQVIEAVTKLDDAGFHGPYALALAPSLYNQLFRRYPQGNQTVMGHVKELITEGIVKAPVLADGGVVVASGPYYASIVLGQDLLTGFIGPADGDYEFTLSETVALRLQAPEAVCVLK